MRLPIIDLLVCMYAYVSVCLFLLETSIVPIAPKLFGLNFEAFSLSNEQLQKKTKHCVGKLDHSGFQNRVQFLCDAVGSKVITVLMRPTKSCPTQNLLFFYSKANKFFNQLTHRKTMHCFEKLKHPGFQNCTWFFCEQIGSKVFSSQSHPTSSSSQASLNKLVLKPNLDFEKSNCSFLQCGLGVKKE